MTPQSAIVRGGWLEFLIAFRVLIRNSKVKTPFFG